MWLTRLALRNPVMMLMLSLMTLLLGVVSLRRLAVDLLPDLTVPVIQVGTFYAGAAPEDIERTITQPLERAVSAAPGVDRVESTSRQGASLVSVWFDRSANLDAAQNDVQQRVAQAMSSLPPGLQQPSISKFDITNLPVCWLSLSSEDLDEKQLNDLGHELEPQFSRLPGVASAAVSGGKQREIEVKVNRDALRARGLGILDIVDAVRRSNLILPSGSLRAGNHDFNVFSNTQVTDPRSLHEVIVRPGSGGLGPDSTPPVRLSDVAVVQDGAADQTEIVRVNGQRGVLLRVQKQPGANTIAVVDAVREALPNLRGLPASVKVAITFDQSHYIRSAISSLQHEAVWGGVLAVLVILFFLASLRATGIVAIAIPLSVVATFVLLYFTGQTLNVFTLGGLALGIGRLVDDSIVELENIHRHLAVEKDRKSAVLAAAQEVAMPILVSTITTIVVFFPVLFLQGVARDAFVPLALTIAFSLGMSFLVSRTVTPLLCLRALRSHGGETRGLAGVVTRFLDSMDHGYARILRWVLGHRLVTLGFIGLVFGLSLLLSRGIGQEFFPQTDESQVNVNFRGPIGTRVERSEEVAKRIETRVQEVLGEPVGENPPADKSRAVRSMRVNAGMPSGRAAFFQRNGGPHSGSVSLNLVPRSARKEGDLQVIERLRAAMRDELPGHLITFSSGGIVRRMLNFGAPDPLEVEILGQNMDAGMDYANVLLPRLQGLRDSHGRPLMKDLVISREVNYPELQVQVDRAKAGVLGLSEQQIAQTVLTSLVGNTQFAPIPFTDPHTGREYFINVRLEDEFRSHVSDLGDIFLRTPSGGVVPLSTVADIKRSAGPVAITRRYMQRMISITGDYAPTADLGAASAAARRVLAELTPPAGFSVRLGGQTEAQEKTFADLRTAALIALALVYMVLASQFKSLVDPLVIMFSVPLGITGVFIILYLTGTTLNVNSYMGVIMMVGIVVSNGVLLVDFANVLRGRGKSLIDATVDAGRTRLRPILMTSLATVVGLIPMALGVGEGSESNLPLARAVIGGLTVSTLFTLFLVPVLYTLFEKLARRSHGSDEETLPDVNAVSA
jgi:hydrophobe/amphiphile efflux-1 (HAE1) family protein